MTKLNYVSMCIMRLTGFRWIYGWHYYARFGELYKTQSLLFSDPICKRNQTVMIFQCSKKYIEKTTTIYSKTVASFIKIQTLELLLLKSRLI